MILEVLAASVVASSAPPPSGAASTVEPLTVTPLPKATTPPVATVEIPSDDSGGGRGAWAVIWPAGAFRAHISGHVVLSCDIDRYGLAEWCQVASETPEKQGFGAAAMALRPTLKVKPAMGPDGPIDRVMNIAVEFKAPDDHTDWGSMRGGGDIKDTAGDITSFGAPALKGRVVSVLNNPVWASTVSYADVARAYPVKADGASGYAVAHCAVDRKGALSACEPIKEDPPGRGFGQAAVELASRFRVAPQWATAPGHADLWVDVPIRFDPPGATEPRAIDKPYWVAGFDPEQALKVYPAEAAAKGVASGYGVAACTVAETGALTDCAPEPADPAGLGFSEAAVRLASTMRLNPWTSDGAPVDGAVVRVAVRLSLKAQP